MVQPTLIEELREQLTELSRWKRIQEKRLKVVTWSLIVGVVLFAVGGTLSTGLTADLTWSNRRLLNQVQTLSQREANASYTTCTTRNQQTEQSRRLLQALVAAHTRDGDENASRFWNGYLDTLNKQKLPTCVKPPGYTAPTTTTIKE